LIELRARKKAERLTEPIGRFLARAHLTPAFVTLVGLTITVGGAVIVALGYLAVGSLVIGIGSAVDSLDGAVARATGRVSDRGAFMDSISDRVGETAMWASLAYAVPDPGIVPFLSILNLGGSLLTSYLRAKAESVGAEGRGGLLGRAERVILYIVALTFNSILQPLLWLMLVGIWLTVAYRFAITWRQLRT
jgi:CDP-diacylglycerol--glycerol-3-phosphate 3-phosphatidyltransferase